MKIALISDIHGNFSALEAVLKHARGQGVVEAVLNLGDMIGYGPEPEKVVRWAQSPQIISLLGDYDKKVLSKKHRKEQWSRVDNPNKRLMFAWTYQALSKNSRKFLKSLPEKRTLVIKNLRFLITHTSPDPENAYLGPETSPDHFAKLAAKLDVDAVLYGHSHKALILKENGVTFINPGSVGRLDDGDPRASYALLDIEEGKLQVQLFRVPYPIVKTIQALRQKGLPEVFCQVIRQGLNYDDVVRQFGESPLADWLEPSGIVTFLTDFGLKDHFVGIMKGVIARIAPQAEVIDISHQISPQNISEGSQMLLEAVPYFPPGTVHVAIVHTGEGSERQGFAAQIGDQFFVASDNGLLSPLIQQAKENQQPVEIILLNQSQYWLSKPSQSLHGRDIFVPVAAHLANGFPIDKLGERINDPIFADLTSIL